MRYIWLLAVPILGCAVESPVSSPSTVRLLTGLDDDAWTSAPAPTTVQIDFVESTKRTELGRSSAPATEVTLHTAGLSTNTIATFEATALDADGNAAARGVTVPFLVRGIDGISIPLFLARTGAWSRPPDRFEHPHLRPVVAQAFHKYIIAAGGDPVAAGNPAIPDFYDMVTYATLRGQPPFRRAPKTMAVRSRIVLLIDEADATWTNLSDNLDFAATAPVGVSFPEVAGGEAFELADGNVFVIGGTRTAGDATSKALRIDGQAVSLNSILRGLLLSTPRLGAAAAVIDGNLIVAGGSADGPGVETLNKAQDAFVALPFPPDATTGLGLAPLDGTTAIVGGGTDPATGKASPLRTFDAACVADCSTTEVGTLPIALQRTKIFSIAAGTVLVVGEDETGENRAYTVVVSGGTTEIVERPLRERRKFGTPLRLPNSLVGIVGGADPDKGTPILTFESFQP